MLGYCLLPLALSLLVCCLAQLYLATSTPDICVYMLGYCLLPLALSLLVCRLILLFQSSTALLVIRAIVVLLGNLIHVCNSGFKKILKIISHSLLYLHFLLLLVIFLEILTLLLETGI